jgi:glutamate---cysteine ligase / carboxylate-amine ligase
VTDAFGREAPWSLGVEEEFFLVDAGSLAAVPAFSRVVGEASAELKPELFECLVELATPVVPDACATLEELLRLRRELADGAEQHGVALYAAGTHALARGADQPLVPLERYRQLAELLGEGISRQLVCGLHVHVSFPDWGKCLRAFEGILPWLPTLLALSANSPLAEGGPTGRRSERAVRLLDLPTGGTPPVVRSPADWEDATGGDQGRRHWDAWPRPEYGTLEVRVMDMQTDVRRSAGFAELVRALLVAVAEGRPEPYDRALYARRRADAADRPPSAGELDALSALVGPQLDSSAGRLADALLEEPAEADRQLAVAAAEGVAAVPADVVRRTLGF